MLENPLRGNPNCDVYLGIICGLFLALILPSSDNGKDELMEQISTLDGKVSSYQLLVKMYEIIVGQEQDLSKEQLEQISLMNAITVIELYEVLRQLVASGELKPTNENQFKNMKNLSL